MKRHLLTTLFSTVILTSAFADSTVVFNELMYRSHTNEAVNEWIELHNQMAVNMDISGWSLADGIDFKFAEGTVIPGRGYLVVASSPATLIAAGVTNVVGPFTGRLSNSGEAIELLNNNQRLMDLIEYEADDDNWPAAPDGSGVALAKRKENSASDAAANWTSSLQVGGTPGAANFPSAFSETVTTTLVPINATWRYEQSGANLGTTWSKTNFNDNGWASATALFANETCDCLPEPIGTTLVLGRTNYYFRTTFNFTGNPAQTTLNLRHIIDDGLVVYLNGTEIWRMGMPAGTIIHNTLASRAVPNAAYEGPFTVPSSALVIGQNILAVEVHQQSIGSTDVVFGLSLTESHPNSAAIYEKPTVAFNEMAGTNTPFWLELINYGATNVSLDGMAIVGLSGTRPEYIFPPTTLVPGEIFPVTGTTLNFSPNTNNKLALYTANRSHVVDAATVKFTSRARFPDGVGSWMMPTQETPGASNLVTLRHEIVINEIMYDHRPLPPLPGVNSPTNVLISSTNLWRYRQDGIDLGTSWRQNGYNDAAWPTGNALFHAIPAFLPAPKNTPLQLTNNSGERIVTWYFRTPFVFTGDVATAELMLNPIIDDGAVFYLNGAEVYRHNMPNGTINYGTLANVSVATPVFSGPVSFPAGFLLSGTNYLAVELHQFATNVLTVDAVFGTELLVTSFVSPPLAERESPESWIELHNHSTNAVSLSGWILADGIEFAFATNQTIAPGGYLVVAKDPAYMLSLYPSLNVVGPFEKSLSGSSDHLVLRDAAGNVADEVRYFNAGRWPEYANGAGSSLELRDPRADNAQPEAWAASDESTKTGWNTYSYRGIATAEAAASPTIWNELVLGLLDAGELLLDDISVVESPDGAATQLIQNRNFSSGLNSWRILGNHKGNVIPDPDNGGNNVLRLVATGSTGHMHNHVETTFANNAQIVNGREYEISFRAKWIAGNNGLLSRLYFNRLPRVTSLVIPELSGTPGARNSRYATNAGPTFVGFHHTPVVPQTAQAVSVSVKPSDEDGVNSVILWWSANGGAWNQTSMVMAQSTDEWTGNIPGASAGTLVQFYVEGTDGAGKKSTFPAGGTNSRALYKVNDSSPVFDQLHNVRILMTTADANLLHASTNVMSSDFMGATVIYNEEQVFYDMKVHLQGSQRGRDNSARVGFTLRFNTDDLFRGVHETISIDRSGGYSGRGGKQDEILIKHAVTHAGGLPGMYDDLVYVLAPRSQENSTGLLVMSKYNKVFLDSQYDNGGDGDLFKLELIYYPTTTSDGTPQGYKMPNPDQVLGTDFRDLGNDKESYRWNFLNENHSAADDFSGIMTVAKTLGLNGAALDTTSRQTLDVNQWMRAFALESLFGVNDTYGFGLEHNFMVYAPPENQPAVALLWDMDFGFSRGVNSAITPSGNVGKLTALPGNLRLYYSHLYDLISTTVNTAYLGPWAAHYGGLVGQNWSGALDYIGQRTSYVLGQLPTATAFAITSNGGNNFSVSNRFVTLTGTAPIQLETIQVNGINYPLTWASATDWTLETPIVFGTNFLTFQGMNRYGSILSNLVDTIQVVNTAQVAVPKPVLINEWMADNAGPGGYRDPVDNVFQDWFELYNPNTNAVNLSGYFLTDTLAQTNKWQIPANTFIAANGFLLVWADNEPAQNGLSPFGDLHANFALGKGGEDLALFAPDGTLQSSITFGPQLENISQGLYVDGNTNNIQSMPNWTPRAANQLNAPPSPTIGGVIGMMDGSIAFEWTALLHRNYRVDFKDSLDAPTWTPLSTNSAIGQTLTVTDTNISGAQRFYRVVLLQ